MDVVDLSKSTSVLIELEFATVGVVTLDFGGKLFTFPCLLCFFFLILIPINFINGSYASMK